MQKFFSSVPKYMIKKISPGARHKTAYWSNITRFEKHQASGISLRHAAVNEFSYFHVAGNTNLWSRRNHIQTRDNVEGTKNMVAAALKRQSKRFIHTSSTAAYGHHQQRINEETQSNAIQSPINYHRTKYLAEMEVRKGIEKGLDAVMLNPANIIGPYDYNNWSQLFILIDRQKLPGVPPATQTFCHVREVVKAHITAFYRGKKGEN